jgi:hypothetical protein
MISSIDPGQLDQNQVTDYPKTNHNKKESSTTRLSF